ncbi:MAG: M20/M25/M40 family metallo-hydrolase [Chloroflexi bacterium]|nr:M20/M25/M40 family metallo-hydrolase [Chloroflexota bacterium]
MTTPTRDAILQWVDAHQADVIGLAQSLVRIPSENKPPHGSEKACQMFVAEILRDIGCRVDVFTPPEVVGLTEHPAYWPGRDYTDRPNVVGVMSPQPEGPVGKAAGRKSLLFTGHIDVVPAVGQGKYTWWDGTIEDGRLYGRGANDMKGGIATYLMAARCIRELGFELKGDLILETVVDEEFGGAHGSLACCLRGYNADLAILSEPNNMLVSTAHRGGQQFRLFTCTEGVGMGFGDTILRDPVTALGHLLAALDRYNEERNARPRPKGFENDVFPLMPFLLRSGELLPWGTGEAIPDTAWVEFWIEIPPGVTEEQLKSELRGVVAQATEVTPTLQRVTTRWEERTRFLAGSSMADDHPLVGVLATNLAAVTGQPPAFGPAPFACDGFIFNLHSPTPVVIVGPHGANAHAPDEWVSVADLVALTKTYALTIADWLI